MGWDPGVVSQGPVGFGNAEQSPSKHGHFKSIVRGINADIALHLLPRKKREHGSVFINPSEIDGKPLLL